MAVTLPACYLPARRATQIDPMITRRIISFGVERMTMLMDTYADRQANIDLLDRLTVWLDEDIGSKPDDIFDHDVSVRTPGGEANGFDNAVAQAGRTDNETEVNPPPPQAASCAE